MNSELIYLLAHGKQRENDLNCPYVTFTPADNPAEVKVGIYCGFVPYDPGAECEPEFILRTPGLIEHLHKLDLQWFIPFIERLAAGGTVSLDEVQSAFRQQTGSEMETTKKSPYRFAFMSKRISAE